jgi:protein-tyrosine phosphatase
VIDLHSHILHGVDDGARTLETSLAMAKMAVADGISVMACTPHFMPGLYDSESHDIRQRVAQLNEELHHQGIDLALVVGADAHMRPDLIDALRNHRILTLHDTRYFLFEPPHTTMPRQMDELLFNTQMAGYVPILTHPERFKWIEQNYEVFCTLAKSGVWMQITAGSLTGRFGSRAQYWAQRMLAEGLVSIIATDTHDTRARPPLLREAFDVAVTEVGPVEAENLVLNRPTCVLENTPVEEVPPVFIGHRVVERKASIWQRLFGS